MEGSIRTLTFEERVSYQRAIEEVYWRHRIWPKERKDPKPSLDAVMSQAQLEKKVSDYLRNSQVLEDHWQRPITAEQLQAEMDRMAKHTKQPEVLQELFEALGNDPFVIAECLAKPAVAERLLTNWYAYDQRIHGELKQRAKAELQALTSVAQMKRLSGKYSEIELVKSAALQGKDNHGPEHGLKLNRSEWNKVVQKLGANFGDRTVAAGVSPAKVPTLTQIKTGVLSALQEDETRYYAIGVIDKTDNHLKLATVCWLKEPFESRLPKVENQILVGIVATSAKYTLPKISEGSGCLDDTWTATSGPPDTRPGPTAVWTGSEMIVWGGLTATFTYFNTGGRYNPATDDWTTTTKTNAPSARGYHTAVWSGSEMIIWGGFDESLNYSNTGGRYNPETDSWTGTASDNVPSARSRHTAVWSGTEMIIWGGYDGMTEVNTGGRYNPSTDSWISTDTSNAPIGRYSHTAVWTGSEMIVWGGFDESFNYSNTGGRYNPETNSWTATSLTTVPDGRELHSAVWTGSEMIVWGGDSGGAPFNTGGRYLPATNSWTATSTANAPSGRLGHTAVWTGSEMIVWGGQDDSFVELDTGGRYNPNMDIWTATNTTNAPVARAGHAAVWSGSEMIIWGGVGNIGVVAEIGGRYNPTTDSWTPTGHSPSRRSRHAAVWTGNEMIVWGGIDLLFLDTGGKYTPSTDNWMPTTTINAPTERELSTAVWTGTEMIIWGGYSYDGNDHYWNTGGRYNPGTDNWTATSIANAPTGRELHTAVWTGSAMIIWGGYYADPFGHDLNTGGNYDSEMDSWTATTTVGAPSERDSHAAVWTGSEMIVWGGPFFDASGGRYNPSTNTWIATSTANAPAGRAGPKAVWIGSEMIVWGGYFYDGTYHYLNTGGKYNPNANSWTATSTTNAPEARSSHSAIWTGNEMIVWGGEAGDALGYYFSTGGRYDPIMDSWIATNTVSAPDGRFAHTAVWTGNEMIVWGGTPYPSGYTSTGGRYCVQSGATPTPTPTVTPSATPRATPRPRPIPHSRPTPRQ